MTRQQVLRLAVVAVCSVVAIVWMASWTGAVAETYEIRPEIELEAYQTDADRILSAYERLMDQYLALVQTHLTGISADSRKGLARLESIERKLDDLAVRLAAIEKLQTPHAPQSAAPHAPSAAPTAARP